MRNRLTAYRELGLLLFILGLSLSTTAGAVPQFESTIVLNHWSSYSYQEGGADVGYAQESESSGWVPVWGGYYEQSADVAAEASASAGVLRAYAKGGVLLNPTCNPCSAGTPFATAVARAWDSFQIQAGGGYENGDIVQVRVLASLAGNVLLQGTPGGGNDWSFRVFFGPSNGANADNLFKLDLYSGGLLPPYEASIGPLQWDEVVNVEVGKKYYLWGYLSAGERGSGFYGYGPGTYFDLVDFYGTGTLGLGYAPGFENVSIVSAAGAPVAPAPGFSFSLSKSLTPGCRGVIGTVTLAGPAPAAGVVVALTDTLDSATTPATLKFLAGTIRRTFTVRTSAVQSIETGTVSATLEQRTISRPLQVRPMGLTSITLTPTSVVGSQPVTGKATLECNAGPGPITVDLSSNNAAVASPIAASIVVPQGVKTANFDVATNAVQVKSYATISGTANGITKSKKLTVNVAAAVSPTSIRFGNVTVGTTSAPQNATLTNKGVVSFSVNSISLTGTAAAWFAQTNNCPASLAPGSSCTIAVTFTPTIAAFRSAKLTITTSATSTPLSVSLSGTGI